MRLLLLSLLIAACSGPAGVPSNGPPNASEDDTLALAWAKWRDADLQNYELTITRSCECMPEDAGPFVVTVENGETTSVLYDGRPAGSGEPPTVEGLFALLESAFAEGAPRVEATYHEDWGYPVRVFIDRDLQVADEEVSYRISELILR